MVKIVSAYTRESSPFSDDEATCSALDVIEDHPNGTLTNCRVCSGTTSRNHYGIASCNACAAFFRRTIIQRRNYFCSKQNCGVTEEKGGKRVCKSCRFQKCVAAGMVIDAVWRRKLMVDADQFKDCSLLQRLLRARQAAFVNKVNIMAKLSAKYNKRMTIGMLKPDLDQTELSKESEFDVLLIYMRDTGFEEMGLDQLDIVRIAARIFYRWLFLSAVAVTLRNGGHHNNTVYFSDRGHVPVNSDDCEDFLARHRLRDVAVLARSWHELFRKGMKIAYRFHGARLDKTEFSVLSQLLALQEAKELHPANKEIAAQADQIFKDMKQYYTDNYSDVALRLGSLILLLNDINEAQGKMHEFAMLLVLSGYDTILNRVMRAHGV